MVPFTLKAQEGRLWASRTVTQAHQDTSPQAFESTTLPRSCPQASKPGLPPPSKPGKMLSFYSGANTTYSRHGISQYFGYFGPV